VDAFADWMGRVERLIRLSLRRFARAADVEGVVQETLMRMWLLAREPERRLTGEDASLRYALGMARNIARSEARRLGGDASADRRFARGPVSPDRPPTRDSRAPSGSASRSSRASRARL